MISIPSLERESRVLFYPPKPQSSPSTAQAGHAHYASNRLSGSSFSSSESSLSSLSSSSSSSSLSDAVLLTPDPRPQMTPSGLPSTLDDLPFRFPAHPPASSPCSGSSARPAFPHPRPPPSADRDQEHVHDTRAHFAYQYSPSAPAVPVSPTSYDYPSAEDSFARDDPYGPSPPGTGTSTSSGGPYGVGVGMDRDMDLGMGQPMAHNMNLMRMADDSGAAMRYDIGMGVGMSIDASGAMSAASAWSGMSASGAIPNPLAMSGSANVGASVSSSASGASMGADLQRSPSHYQSHPQTQPAQPAPSKQYSFVALAGNTVKKRPRRRYDEIERLYRCSYPSCNKSYGTLNHLNAHVVMQKHGGKRSPSEFKELRKQWRKAKKEESVGFNPSASTTVNTGFGAAVSGNSTDRFDRSLRMPGRDLRAEHNRDMALRAGQNIDLRGLPMSMSMRGPHASVPASASMLSLQAMRGQDSHAMHPPQVPHISQHGLALHQQNYQQPPQVQTQHSPLLQQQHQSVSSSAMRPASIHGLPSLSSAMGSMGMDPTGLGPLGSMGSVSTMGSLGSMNGVSSLGSVMYSGPSGDSHSDNSPSAAMYRAPRRESFDVSMLSVRRETFEGLPPLGTGGSNGHGHGLGVGTARDFEEIRRGSVDELRRGAFENVRRASVDDMRRASFDNVMATADARRGSFDALLRRDRDAYGYDGIVNRRTTYEYDAIRRDSYDGSEQDGRQDMRQDSLGEHAQDVRRGSFDDFEARRSSFDDHDGGRSSFDDYDERRDSFDAHGQVGGDIGIEQDNTQHPVHHLATRILGMPLHHQYQADSSVDSGAVPLPHLPAPAHMAMNRLPPDSTLLTPLPGYEPPVGLEELEATGDVDRDRDTSVAYDQDQHEAQDDDGMSYHHGEHVRQSWQNGETGVSTVSPGITSGVRYDVRSTTEAASSYGTARRMPSVYEDFPASATEYEDTARPGSGHSAYGGEYVQSLMQRRSRQGSDSTSVDYV